MTTIICPHCGKDVAEDAAFCAVCGGALELPITATAETTETVLPCPPAKKGTPVWWQVLRCVFSIPLTALLVVSLIAFTALSTARNLPKERTIKSLFNEIQPTEILTEILSEGETDSFSSLIYDTYKQAAIEGGATEMLTKAELQTVLEASTLDDFLSEKTAEYLAAFMNGDYRVGVSKDELLDLVRENEDVICEVTGVRALTADDYALLEDIIDETGLTDDMDLSQIVPPEVSAMTDTVQFVYNEVFYAVIGLCLLLVLLIALLNLRGRFLTSLYSGIALLLAGALTSLTLAMEAFAIHLLTTVGLPFSVNALSALVHTTLSGFWQVGLCMIGGGLLCIALFVILRLLAKRRKAA